MIHLVDSEGHQHNKCANCDLSMKFGSYVPYTRTIKAKLYIDPLGQKRPPIGFLLTFRNHMLKVNRTSPPLDKIAPRTSHMLKNKISEIWLCYISVNFKFYVISEKYKNEMFKINRNTHLLPSGQNSLN